MNKTPLGIVHFCSYEESVPALMELLGAARVLGEQKRVVIKPNLVNTSRPPITTPVQLVAAITDYVKSVSNAETIIAEGCGAPIYILTDLFVNSVTRIWPSPTVLFWWISIMPKQRNSPITVAVSSPSS